MANEASIMGVTAPDLASNVADVGMQYGFDKLQAGQMATAAQQSEAWSNQESSTAWQRGVADVRAAGLNPALSFMSGPAASPTAPMAGVPDMTHIMSTSNSTAGDVGNMVENLKLVQAQRANVGANTQKALADAQSTIAAIPNYASTRQLQDAQSHLATMQAGLADLEGKNTVQQLNAQQNTPGYYQLDAVSRLLHGGGGAGALMNGIGGALSLAGGL